jgi:hypothetical protein
MSPLRAPAAPGPARAAERYTLFASDPPVPQAFTPQTARPEPHIVSTWVKQAESVQDFDVQDWPEQEVV